MTRARNGEIEVAYETLGDPADPALILVHGLGSSMLVWHDEMCAGFADRGFFVLRVDHRDAGLSTVLAEGSRYTLTDMAGDVVSVLDDARLQACHRLWILAGRHGCSGDGRRAPRPGGRAGVGLVAHG